MRNIQAAFRDFPERRVYRVVSASALVREWRPDRRFLVILESGEDAAALSRWHVSGINNIAAASELDFSSCLPGSVPQVVTPLSGVEEGDVVVANVSRGELCVLYRDSDMHHSILLTNRCNSHCLMCSQPPTRHDDSWLVDEAKDIAHHIARSPDSIGLSGGEPLLLGTALRDVIETFRSEHPTTRLDILSNGRLLSRRPIADDLLTDLPSESVTWMIPLYGHADFIHDFVVQSPGAFEETLSGLLVLQEHNQPIQLRIVLIGPVLRILPELCRFIGHNLPFVREVALMACEPIGYALANRDQCEVDLTSWQPELLSAAAILSRAAIPHLFMNTPLCALPRELWDRAHQSISDWKRVYAEECAGCEIRGICSGLFAWHNQSWRPATIRAVRTEVPSQ